MSAHLEQQSLKLTQLVEDYHPVLRRRAYTSIRTSFPTFFSSEVQPNVLSMNESQKVISQNFSKINQIIDLVDDHIRRRIECYENEVVSVVQKQIQQMREQTQKVVAQFNSMIQEKNKENQIWSLNNELDYFKSEAKKLFDHNKKLRKENQELRHKFKEYEWELQNREIIMQKLWYKYQKEKYHKGKLKTMMDQELQNIQNGSSGKRKNSKPQIMEFSLKEDVFNFEEMPELKLNSIKPLKQLKELRKPSPIEQKLDQSQKLIRQIADNSLLLIDYEDQSQISKIQFKGKSTSILHPKPQMKDQQSQVNIYLSEHSYKSLFQKKLINKKALKTSQEIAIQTEEGQKTPATFKRQNQIILSSPKRGKEINFTKNGFYVNEVPNQKTTHYRSISSNFTSTKRQSFYNFKDRRERLATETNFNKTQDEEFDIQLITHKYEKGNKKLYCKMAKRLERNKIVQRAYDKLHRSKQK